jgi:hypothetical protein
MNSTIPADLLELSVRVETWRTNRKYVREPIPDELRSQSNCDQDLSSSATALILRSESLGGES